MMDSSDDSSSSRKKKAKCLVPNVLPINISSNYTSLPLSKPPNTLLSKACISTLEVKNYHLIIRVITHTCQFSDRRGFK
ncbi:unnamed protein product [Lactuca virosa]|uniref:Uncharacterized protein n=1 Tax=Lactuca virosa TaxID=75947 RepID=A0AAU9PNS8_9ASTR|nr:unnamed protein product [Lactuca virosa]